MRTPRPEVIVGVVLPTAAMCAAKALLGLVSRCKSSLRITVKVGEGGERAREEALSD